MELPPPPVEELPPPPVPPPVEELPPPPVPPPVEELLPPPVGDTSVSDVLTSKDLLPGILLRLGCRGCLVSAALTSKRWLRYASKLPVPDFLCTHHQPRLLGAYVSSGGMISGSEFISLPDPFSPAVSTVLNHADFGFGFLPAPNVWDCRNGSVLFDFGGDETFHDAGLAVRSPLLYPNKDKVVDLPLSPQVSCFSQYPHAMLLPADHGDDASCYRISVRTWEPNNMVTVLVFVLRSGSWDIHCMATGTLAKPPVQVLLTTTVLAGGKMYMATEAGYILGLDLAKETFFMVDLPEGVERENPGSLVHCRGHDSVLYLFHVDGENRLNLWLRRMNEDHGHGAGAGAAAGGSANNGWVLKDTVSVGETCGHLVEQGWETAGDGEDDYAAAVMVVGAGDNAEFVFLELGNTGVVVYMHLQTREVKQVYQREPDDDFLIRVRPFMFAGPPVFPPVQDSDEDEEGEAALHQE